MGNLGCLQECVEAGRGSGWRAGGQAQMRENLADHGSYALSAFEQHVNDIGADVSCSSGNDDLALPNATSAGRCRRSVRGGREGWLWRNHRGFELGRQAASRHDKGRRQRTLGTRSAHGYRK